VHYTIAAWTGQEELMLSSKEAKKLADAIQAVGRQYEIVMTPKQAAWAQLGLAATGIYGPRAGKIVWGRIRQRGAVVEPIVPVDPNAHMN